MTLEQFLARLPGARKSGKQWTARCPGHDDSTASLCISEGEGGRVLLKCQASCTTPHVVGKMGLTMADLNNGAKKSAARNDILATYDYLDEAGELLSQAVRYPNKKFSQRKPDGQGGWDWDIDGVRRVPYRLPEVLAAKFVLVCEGEKDCNTARELELVATCNAMGAGKWREEHSEPLRGKTVCIIADGDKPGRSHAQQVAAALTGKATSVRCIELPGNGKDLTDWATAGGTREALTALIAQAPEWTAGQEPWRGPGPWPAPESLGEDLPPVPAVDLEMLPASLRGLVADISELMQTPPDFAASAAIVALSGCVGRRARIWPKVQDSTWEIIPNLWGMIVAPPGFLKSPVMQAIARPLAHVEEMWRSEHAGEVANFETEKEKKNWRIRLGANSTRRL